MSSLPVSVRRNETDEHTVGLKRRQIDLKVTDHLKMTDVILGIEERNRPAIALQCATHQDRHAEFQHAASEVSTCVRHKVLTLRF
jgi:hypothetical protein